MSSIEKTLSSLDYSKSDPEAHKRYEATRFLDPLRTINCALLNKEDIARYVAETGMLYPFHWEKLKPASYEAQLGNEVLFWDEAGKECHQTNLSSLQSIKFRRNSITYVGLNIRFRLPIYIAVRFNLTITHVHRGLLLGTGPLVDPGYQGYLMIPIHNLTPNDYLVRPGDDLVAIEFTKISDNEFWKEKTSGQDLADREFLLRNVKKGGDKSFAELLDNALPEEIDSVKSSLGEAIENAEETVKNADAAIKKVEKHNLRVSVIVVAAVSAVVIALLAVIASLQIHLYQWRDAIQDKVQILEHSLKSQKETAGQEVEGQKAPVNIPDPHMRAPTAPKSNAKVSTPKKVTPESARDAGAAPGSKPNNAK